LADARVLAVVLAAFVSSRGARIRGSFYWQILLSRPWHPHCV